MNERLHAPLFLPTLLFIVGCLICQRLDLNVWIPLAVVMVAGVFFVFRSWSVLLLVVALGVGGVRGSLGENRHYLWSADGALNRGAQQRVEELHLSPRAESLVKAMVLGKRSEITREQRVHYAHSGASHILALSGLHISIIFIALNIMLLPLVLLPRGHIVRNVAIIILIWAYALIVGLSPSVLRSVVMFTLLQLSFATGHPYNGINAILFTILVAVAASPAILYSVGFQLSVVAISAIYLWALPLYYRLFGGGGVLVSALCIGFACSVATLPIVSYYFGYVALLSAPLSPLFILTAFIIVSCGALWIALPFGFVAPVLRFAIDSAVMVQERTVEWIAHVEWGSVMWRASEIELWGAYLIYAIITILVWSRE